MKTKGFIMLLASALVVLTVSCKSSGKKAEEQTEGQAIEAPAADNTLTQAEIDDGWKLLFDGETTNGWRGYDRDSFPQAGWVVADGALMCQGSGQGEAGGQGGDIIYDKKFKDFDLKLEWKISEGGNSGIFYLAEEVPGEEIWKNAPEMQILDNERHIDANMGKDGNRKAGSLYDLIPAVPQNAHPAGEWNQVEIIVYQGTVVHKMNGEQVLEYHLGTPDFEAIVAGSKFKDYPEFAKYREGYIGLQDHGNDVWFRNIKIKEL